ncbi:SDR family NAD(P)-dependent oxidoreductase [Phenylobacterium sp.]|uniref:SDR family NAD(P)-dependent oxidoreductase n=1 Tax=Phenylobacterium sp. TaxID=1871053 RepID=UPI0027340175|nr:SDR family NAD(P)-dependent oxidoreductase [Phenylobacterium sp.]MDP3852301.1 SDR family NAD(P)-dependent oxidoreductase [Phenylobacterium sp.]
MPETTEESAGTARDMRDRVVIVTGAGKGLGRAYALDLAARGANVVVNNRWTDRGQPSSAEAVAAEIRAAGGRAAASLVPAEDPEAGEALVAQAMTEFGRLDAVVSNAGVPETLRLHRQTREGFRKIFDINFFGAFDLVRAAWPALSASGSGRIVVSASSAGLHGGDGMAAYASSKAALIGLVRGLAVEGAARGLKINAIAPYALTAMTETFVAPDVAVRMDPAAVAPLVSWLVSDACDVTGQTLVSGGCLMRAARTVEGPPVRLETGQIGAAVGIALTAEPREPYDDAHQAFAAFMDGRRTLDPTRSLVQSD